MVSHRNPSETTKDPGENGRTVSYNASNNFQSKKLVFNARIAPTKANQSDNFNQPRSIRLKGHALSRIRWVFFWTFFLTFQFRIVWQFCTPNATKCFEWFSICFCIHCQFHWNKNTFAAFGREGIVFGVNEMLVYDVTIVNMCVYIIFQLVVEYCLSAVHSICGCQQARTLCYARTQRRASRNLNARHQLR